MKFSVQIVIKNEYGEFKGEKLVVSLEQYTNIVNLSKNFYMTSGFEMTMEDGTFLVLPPDIVKRSILLVEKEEIK